MKMVTLTVLMSAYNAEKYISQAIQSILNQSYKDFELIVADDGSSDQTRKIIDRFQAHPKMRIIHNESNLGKTKTINNLYREANGKYVSIHDADDCSHPKRFERQLALMELQDQVIMCGTSFHIIRANGDEFGKGDMPVNYHKIKEDIVIKSQFHGPTMIVRRSIVDSALQGLLYREFFMDYHEDCDLSIRLVELGECTNLPEYLYFYRIVPGSLSKIFTERKKCLYRILVHFHKQRLRNGSDDLVSGNTVVAERKIQYLMRKEYSDTTKIYRENAAFLMYYNEGFAAINMALKAVRFDIFLLENWRTLQYCIRKTLLRI